MREKPGLALHARDERRCGGVSCAATATARLRRLRGIPVRLRKLRETPARLGKLYGIPARLRQLRGIPARWRKLRGIPARSRKLRGNPARLSKLRVLTWGAPTRRCRRKREAPALSCRQQRGLTRPLPRASRSADRVVCLPRGGAARSAPSLHGACGCRERWPLCPLPSGFSAFPACSPVMGPVKRARPICTLAPSRFRGRAESPRAVGTHEPGGPRAGRESFGSMPV